MSTNQLTLNAKNINRENGISEEIQANGYKELAALKRSAKETQKNGLPFMMASVVIWGVIALVQLTNKNIQTLNFYTFMSSSLLMPLALLFSIPLKANIFKDRKNPIHKLGFLCTMNQCLYLLIVMWAFNQKPEAMLMVYAMVFGAHLLPFSWVYDSKPYMVFAIIETITALAVSIFFPNIVLAAFMVIMQAILSLLLFFDMRKAEKISESRNNN